jgi:hypothetical protein
VWPAAHSCLTSVGPEPPATHPTSLLLLMQQFFDTAPPRSHFSETPDGRCSQSYFAQLHRVEAGRSYDLSFGLDLPDLQGPPGGGASDALDSLGKPAGSPTAPTTWRPALGTLPIDPAHFLLALLLLRSFSRRVAASPPAWSTVPGAVEQWKTGEDGERFLQDLGHLTWHLGEISHGKRNDKDRQAEHRT